MAIPGGHCKNDLLVKECPFGRKNGPGPREVGGTLGGLVFGNFADMITSHTDLAEHGMHQIAPEVVGAGRC